MIRPARFGDVLRIVDLMLEMHADSKYVGIANVDEDAARKLVAQCVQRHGGHHDGATLVMVSEVNDVIEGFMIGALDRVYHIGDTLAANDMFLFCSKRASKMDMNRLFDAYLCWAWDNPKVVVVKASWTNSVEGAERMATLYERKNFERVGEIWERLAAREQREQAA